MAVDAAKERAVRRHAGQFDGAWVYDGWRAAFDAPATADANLDDLLTEHAQNTRLVAADILTMMADPAMERKRDLGDVSEDTKGRVKAMLAKAADLRAQVEASAPPTSPRTLPLAGLRVGGSGVPIFRKNCGPLQDPREEP